MIAKTSFGQWLKQRRKALDLTREALAERIGCAAVTLNKIEADERRPSKQMAELFAEQFQIPLDERPAFVRFARSEPTEDAASWQPSLHPPTNLPLQPTPLIGRGEAVAALHKRLLRSESRLLTLIGPPGIGKTRLGLGIAAQALDDFPDGVFFVALAPITDANQVIATIASALGVLDMGPQTPLERLKIFLRDKQTLLLLDNFEQILAAAPQIAELLTACSWLKLLVTSRAPLRIRHERQIPVAPLALPDLAALPDVETMMSYSAVTLFLERAQAVKPDFILTQENAPTVAALCARLDGLPLAIELISARVKLLSLTALLERLRGRLLLQSDGLRDIEPRHRTLNTAIDWSYQLLNSEEQALFRRLGVFVGGWTLEAAEAICAENLTLSVFDGLASLLDKNMVKRDERFVMLETIREYALDQLAVSGESDDMLKRHADYFTVFAESTRIERESPDPVSGLNNLAMELDNLRLALTQSKTAPRLAFALCSFWQQRGHLSEGSTWLAKALAQQDIATLTTQNRTLRAKSLDLLGTFRAWQGDLDTALSCHQESLALFRELEDRMGVARILGTYGMALVIGGDPERAAPLLEESLSLSQELGNTYLIAQCLLFLGNLAYLQGHVEQAGARWEESLTLHRADGNPWNVAIALGFLAMVTLEQDDSQRAKGQLVESLILLRDLDEKWQTAHTLEVFARLAIRQEQPNLVQAARLMGAAEVFRETFSVPILPFLRQFNEQTVAALRAQLEGAAFAAAWSEGRKMTLSHVFAYALDEEVPPFEVPFADRPHDLERGQPQPASDQPLESSLKICELEILRCVAAGFTNREIAAQMFLSPVTVKWYLSEIYSKFNVNSRTQAVARARELSLLS